MTGDVYAKGWNAGYIEAMRDLRRWVGAVNGASIVLSTGEFISRDDVMAAIDRFTADHAQPPTESEHRVLDGNR